MNVDSIIFDLDGTLIDSADGILASFAGAFKHCAINPVRALTHDLIGPPLVPTLHILAGTKDAAVIDPLAAAFKAHYDETGYRATKAYDGVTAMLHRLVQNHWPIFIATNKRKRPTAAIVDQLGWKQYFKAVYALDSLKPPALDKGALIKSIIFAYKLQPDRTLYVGDREEDFLAAVEAGVQFYRANWGYPNCGIYHSTATDTRKFMELLGLVEEY